MALDSNNLLLKIQQGAEKLFFVRYNGPQDAPLTDLSGYSFRFIGRAARSASAQMLWDLTETAMTITGTLIVCTLTPTDTHKVTLAAAKNGWWQFWITPPLGEPRVLLQGPLQATPSLI